MPIFGWDASDFDWDRGPMNLGAAARDGIQFFTHKATEGTRVKHTHYRAALERARDASIPFLGAYIVVRTPGNNGHGSIQAQVAYFLSYLDAQTPWWRTRPEFFLQVDLEHWGYDNVGPQHGAEACALLRAQTGKWVVHYAPRWAYDHSIPGDDPLWASSYGANPAVPYRQGYPGDNSIAWTPYSRRTPVFLQYGSRLTIGSQPGCDANAFRGSVEQLRALITGGNDMGLADDPDGRWMFPRVQAMAQLNTPVGGPEKGVELEFVAAIKEIRANAAAAAKAATAAASAVAPTQEQVDTAILKAMQDPAVQAGIGAGIASHLHVS